MSVIKETKMGVGEKQHLDSVSETVSLPSKDFIRQLCQHYHWKQFAITVNTAFPPMTPKASIPTVTQASKATLNIHNIK